MKRFYILAMAFVLLAMTSSQAMAQRGGFMRMMGGGQELDSTLLAMTEVQDELNFTDEQKDEIGDQAQEILDAMRSEMRDAFMGGGGDREAMMETIQEIMADLRDEEKEIIGKLDDDQKKRLTQLRYQRMGNAMYQDKKVQEALKLKDSQKEAIDDAFESNQDTLEEAMADARESRDFGAMQSAMADAQKELAETLNDLLDEKQQKQAEEMKGKEFKFPEPQRRGRGGRSDF